MATYADLKARIIAETNRDDLADESADILDTHVAMAVRKYGGEVFYFNHRIATATTAADTATISSDFRAIRRVASQYGDLTAMEYDAMPSDTTARGMPVWFSLSDGTVTLYPIPAGAYSLTLYGVLDIPAPDDDADDNAWTNDAADLIAGEVRYTLMRDKFRDVEAASLGKAARDEALIALRFETARRGVVRPTARLRQRYNHYA